MAAKETRLPKLERAIVDYFQAQGWPKAAIADEELRLATVEQAQGLAEKGPPPDRGHRTHLTWTALGILKGVAALKLTLAWSRGRSNVGFLIILWLVAVVMTVVLMFSSEQSEGGKSALAALRELFGSRFQQSLSILPRSDLNEFIMLAAIFGSSSTLCTTKSSEPVDSTSSDWLRRQILVTRQRIESGSLYR